MRRRMIMKGEGKREVHKPDVPCLYALSTPGYVRGSIRNVVGDRYWPRGYLQTAGGRRAVARGLNHALPLQTRKAAYVKFRVWRWG
jgi:hypothetical protein